MLKHQFSPKRGHLSYVDETPCPETEKPPSFKFRNRHRVEGKVDHIILTFDSVQFDQEHVESRYCLSGHEVSSGRYSQLGTSIGLREGMIRRYFQSEEPELVFRSCTDISVT